MRQLYAHKTPWGIEFNEERTYDYCLAFLTHDQLVAALQMFPGSVIHHN